MAEHANFKHGTGFWRGLDGAYGANISDAGRRQPIDMQREIGMLNPKETPFFVMLSQAGKMEADVPEFEWMEDEDFITRSFVANYRASATTDGAGSFDHICWLELKTPADVQGLEAPPYQPACASYDITTPTNSEILFFKLEKVGGTAGQAMYLVFERAALQNVGTWRTVDVSDTDKGPIAASITSPDVEGYVMMIGAKETADDWDPSSADGDDLSWRTSLTAGNSLYDECTILSSTTWTSMTDPGTDFDNDNGDGTDINFEVYVTAYTPNMSNAGFNEGSGIPEESRKSVRVMQNYTQIFKTVYSLTGTAMASRYNGPHEWARKRNKKGKEHKVDIEYSLLFNGAKSKTSDADSPKRKTQGLGIGDTAKGGFIKTHHPGTATTAYVSGTGGSPYCIKHVEGTPSQDFWEDLDGAAERIWDDQVNGSDTKILFCSQKWIGAFSKNNLLGASNNSWGMDPGIGTSAVYGLRITGYQTPYGKVLVVPNPMLRGKYQDWAFFVDFKNLGLKHLPGRNTHIVPNAQNPGDDAVKEYYLTEIGLKCQHEITHGMLRLVTADAS